MSESKFYTETEMLETLKSRLESIGCSVDDIDFENHVFSIDVADELEDEAVDIIESTIFEYSEQRDKVLKSNPFCGVYDLTEKLNPPK